MLKVLKYSNLLVLLPININSTENTREKLVEINMDKDRKVNSASIVNRGTKFFSGINKGHILCFSVHIFIKLGYCN